MKEEIKISINDPSQLEKMYRADRREFKIAFNELFPDFSDHQIAKCWNERLNYERVTSAPRNNLELAVVVLASFFAGLIAKIPQLFALKPEFFYPRNLAFIVFPALITYFLWKNKASLKQVFLIGSILTLSCIYINFLPGTENTVTFVLSCIHLPLFLWAVTGFAFIIKKPTDFSQRLSYLQYNGDLIVMSGLIAIAGGLLTAATFGLFELIGISIEQFYAEKVLIWAAAALPVLSSYLVLNNPQIVNKISPVIAKIFSPLVLITLVTYLIAIAVTGKNPYTERDSLIVFNLLLVGVMALILFSVTGIARGESNRSATWILFFLSVVTIVLNGIALSAILFRISEWGLTPNRLVVVGSNILVLINLMMVATRLLKTVKDNSHVGKVTDGIVQYLPVYAIWFFFVTFILPVLFNFG